MPRIQLRQICTNPMKVPLHVGRVASMCVLDRDQVGKINCGWLEMNINSSDSLMFGVGDIAVYQFGAPLLPLTAEVSFALWYMCVSRCVIRYVRSTAQ